MLGFDAVGKLALGQIPAQNQDADNSQIQRSPLYSRGVSYWRGTDGRSSVPQG